MTYKVYKRIETLDQINDFLESTQKWGKRFYSIKTIHGDKEQTWLDIEAIGISRDLVYLISWKPKATPMPKCVDPADVYAGDAPVKGWIPEAEDEAKKLYPNYDKVPEEKGEYHWITLFRAHGFIRIDRIEEL